MKRISDKEMREINGRLKRAVKIHNKKLILEIYEEVKQYDFQEVGDGSFEVYNRLIDEANNILLQ